MIFLIRQHERKAGIYVAGIDWAQVKGGTELRQKIHDLANPEYNIVERVTPVAQQVQFTLTYAPTITKARMIINDIMYFEGQHFSLNRQTNVLTWTHTLANGGFDIETDDFILLDYWSYTRGS